MTCECEQLVVGPDAVRQRELARFLGLASESGEELPMFSPYIDRAWHDMLEDEEAYARYCREQFGAVIDHVPGVGRGRVAWLEKYHARFGQLPAEWFCDEGGILDREAYEEYRRCGEVVDGGWNCTPKTRPPVVSPDCPKTNPRPSR